MILVSDIKAIVADHFGIESDEISSRVRTRPVAWARQAAMVLACEFTRHCDNRIALLFGLDHTTLMHAKQSVARRCAESVDWNCHMSLLRLRIQLISNALALVHAEPEELAA